jgi:hypothetical protein
MRRLLSVIIFLLSLSFLSVSAQTDTWIPANPTAVVPNQLSVFSCDGKSSVNARWVFRDGGFRVFQSPLLSRSGQTISLDSRVEEWTGGRTLALVPFDKNFDLGVLEPGAYTLEFKSWDTTLKQITFTVAEAPAGAHRIEERCFFVKQHYRDFLSRDADGSGFAFWTKELADCGRDAQCLEVKRIHVSAAFFLAIEFRETGYYVYRMYRAALGRAPNFVEFAPDAAQIGQNVVVADDGAWPIRIGNNKDLYTQSFFNRPEFQAQYNGLTNAQYVDKLFQTAGITPTQTERNDLVASLDHCDFTIGCPTRSSVLRKIVEHPALDRKVFNEGFVTMEYFGYLRRDPDPDGFQFWLSKLNQFNGNFVEAEMVKAFITSGEYRRRFE